MARIEPVQTLNIWRHITIEIILPAISINIIDYAVYIFIREKQKINANYKNVW